VAADCAAAAALRWHRLVTSLPVSRRHQNVNPSLLQRRSPIGDRVLRAEADLGGRTTPSTLSRPQRSLNDSREVLRSVAAG
jgi:hypothetical protein